jgi:hypothetical protein
MPQLKELFALMSGKSKNDGIILFIVTFGRYNEKVHE